MVQVLEDVITITYVTFLFLYSFCEKKKMKDNVFNLQFLTL